MLGGLKPEPQHRVIFESMVPGVQPFSSTTTMFEAVTETPAKQQRSTRRRCAFLGCRFVRGPGRSSGLQIPTYYSNLHSFR